MRKVQKGQIEKYGASDDSDSDDSNVSETDESDSDTEEVTSQSGDDDEDDDDNESDSSKESKEVSEDSEDSDSDSEEEIISQPVNGQTFEKYCMDGVRSFSEVMNTISKKKPETVKATRGISKNISPDVKSMVANFKKAHDHIEIETKYLQELTEKLILKTEKIRNRKSKSEEKVKLSKEEQTTNKSRLRDLDKNISTLGSQMR